MPSFLRPPAPASSFRCRKPPGLCARMQGIEYANPGCLFDPGFCIFRGTH
jgi:hypothetical protein